MRAASNVSPGPNAQAINSGLFEGRLASISFNTNSIVAEDMFPFSKSTFLEADTSDSSRCKVDFILSTICFPPGCMAQPVELGVLSNSDVSSSEVLMLLGTSLDSVIRNPSDDIFQLISFFELGMSRDSKSSSFRRAPVLFEEMRTDAAPSAKMELESK